MSDISVYADPTLFDRQGLEQKLSDGEKPIPAFKACLKHLQDTLNERFRTQRNGQRDIKALVHGRAWAMDQILNTAWCRYDWQGNGVALVAVGGYGRGELLPKSDIDLLILANQESDIEANVDSIQNFLTFLWDIKLEVGSSVRTLDDCQKEAANDVTIVTNLMESRLLAGEDHLRLKMAAMTGPAHIWPSNEFYKAKLNEQINRHQKYNEIEYNLEPNVKASPGGLRDIQMIGWVAKRHFGDNALQDLVDRGYLTEAEYQTLMDGMEFIWRIRYALHMLTGREEDRILFDLQQQLAELFDYQDTESKLAVEQLMQDYFRRVFRLRELNDMLLQHFNEVILPQDLEDRIIPINKRFQIRNGTIETTSNDVFRMTPSAMMEIFVLLAQQPHITGMRASTIRLLHQNRHLIDAHFRQDLRNITYFMELMRSPQGVSTNLRRMSRYGILGLYLPEFGKIIGQMQYDLFHIYTVDAHTLLTIRNLRKFRHPGFTKQFPIVTAIVHRLPKVELLYIAALYHDIGKGRGGDHSELGAVDAEHFCERHRLGRWDSDLVVWLVKNHLLMSMTSQRKDISDPDVIQEFANQVKDTLRLDYLYALTVSDIYSTNPDLWNSWRASLLKQLYVETQRALRRGLENPVHKEERIEETKKKAMDILLADGFTKPEIIDIWDNPGDDYFLRENAENIAWHTKAIAYSGRDVPQVLIKGTNQGSYEGATQIFVYAPDRPHLFADIATVLGSLNLSIHDARIMTSSTSDFALDTFIVLDENGRSIGDDPDRIRDIQHNLLYAITNPDEVKSIERRTPRQLKHFKVPTQVTISNDLTNERTVVELVAADRPGLLARIGDIFREMDIRLQNARISTLGERVEDIFFVLDQNNQPIHDPELCQRLKNELEQQLTEQQ